MQQVIYIRLGKTKKGYTADAGTRPNKTPLYGGSGYRKEALPTIYFAINATVNDSAFNIAARVVGDVNLGDGDYDVAAVEVAPLPIDE